MEHLRSEESELARFGVGNFVERDRVGNHARVRRQHAVHVRPDDDLARVERRAQNRGGIVRSAAAERCGNAFRRRGNVAGDDGNPARFEQGEESRLCFLSRWIGQRTRAPVNFVGHNQIGRVKSHAAEPHFAQHGGG